MEKSTKQFILEQVFLILIQIFKDLGVGYSNINQENLFLYASWDNQRFYIDSALWEGLFQISQVREIQMTGFEFTAASKPRDWQLVPHFESGYKQNFLVSQDFLAILLNPFFMLDWANSWQESYRETGNSPFNIRQKHQYSSLFRTEVGVRFYETCLFDLEFNPSRKGQLCQRPLLSSRSRKCLSHRIFWFIYCRNFGRFPKSRINSMRGHFYAFEHIVPIRHHPLSRRVWLTISIASNKF